MQNLEVHMQHSQSRLESFRKEAQLHNTMKQTAPRPMKQSRPQEQLQSQRA